ncbi:MAG: hypothetical protein A3J79_14120 [Elusimicrobia bacterium RIFOXYB2_FULL_62_6]|nr:MAG: hypothetical protein A3J79_14120 [Elusimicrobia bacterium RIFOXYB2_FULL_62_6]
MNKIFSAIAVCLFGACLTACKQEEIRRGEIIGVKELGVYDAARLDELKKSLPFAFPPARNSVRLRKVIYGTAGLDGTPVKASGLLIVPEGVAAELPVLSYQHGVALNRSDVPSGAKTTDVLLLAAYFGANGYVVLAPDYLGLGESAGTHPYLHARSEASAAEDLLRAVRALPDLKLSGRLFLAGYSQGAHAALALQRSLEAPGAGAFPYKLAGTAGMSGPYDVSGTCFPELLRAPSQASAAYLAYLVFAMNNIYKVFPNLSAALQPPYDKAVPSLFDGKHRAVEIVNALPAAPGELFRPELLQALGKEPAHPLNAALRDNDVYNWKPLAPVRLYYGKADRDVPPENSLKAAKRMKAAGSDARAINVGDALDHQTAVGPAFTAALEWFETLK